MKCFSNFSKLLTPLSGSQQSIKCWLLVSFCNVVHHLSFTWFKLLRPCPHICTYFCNGRFYLHFGFSSTRTCCFRSVKTELCDGLSTNTKTIHCIYFWRKKPQVLHWLIWTVRRLLLSWQCRCAQQMYTPACYSHKDTQQCTNPTFKSTINRIKNKIPLLLR